MRFLLLLLVSFSFTITQAQYSIEVLDSNTFTLGQGVVLSKTSFRGLSVVDDNTIWVSGSKGTIARSIDGGKSFTYNQLKGYEKSDFRDIEAFDDKRAIIMSSGTPAYILKTADGGQTWKEVYKNADTAYFLDAMDFWDDKRGMLVGDPINGHFVLLKTTDGGETWKELDTALTPKAMQGEAVFAASGTSLRCLNKYAFGFITGGKHSRAIISRNCHSNYCWQYDSLPIEQGKNSTGAFSFGVAKKFAIVVGGDYTKDTLVTTNSCATNNYTKKWYKPKTQWQEFNGYRSSVEIINNDLLIACGTSGVDINKASCVGAGRLQHIINISNEGFNVVIKSKKGKAVFLAGDKGRIAKLIYSK